MVDHEIVVRRVRELGRRITALREVMARGETVFLADVNLQAQAERHLQVGLQAAIDVALHIVSADTDQTPQDYASSMRILSEIGVLEVDLAERLRRAVGLRNLLVHAYLAVDPQRIWGHLTNIGDLEEFAAAATRYLDGP
ncbi:MAG: type VII toxin-antitoxin system HepT family RNase toxin [Sporichthyaceae bacterium]